MTIGVKLPGRDAIAQVQPTFAPQNQGAYSPEPVYNAGIAETVPADAAAAKSSSRAAAKAQKKTGRSRNVMIFIFAALLVVCSVLGYFFLQGDIDIMQMSGLVYYDGVTQLEMMAEDTTPFAMIFEESVADGLVAVLPTIFFLGSILTAAIALIGFIAKKYSRLLNLILALGMLAVSLCIVLQPFLLTGMDGASEIMAEYFVNIIESEEYLIFAPAGIGVLHVLFALIFACIPMKKKAV